MRYTDPGGCIRQKPGKLASSRRPTVVARSTQYGGDNAAFATWLASRPVAAEPQPHQLALPARIYCVGVMPSSHGPDNRRET